MDIFDLADKVIEDAGIVPPELMTDEEIKWLADCLVKTIVACPQILMDPK